MSRRTKDRLRVRQRQAPRTRCQWCGLYFPPESVNVDHIVPRAMGGCGRAFNLAHSCIGCNTAKGDRDPVEFWQETHPGETIPYWLSRAWHGEVRGGQK